MKNSYWKSAFKYGIGVVLLAYVLVTNWDAKTKPILPSTISGMLGGGAAASENPVRTSPGLRDVVHRPVRMDAALIAAALCVGTQFVTFVRWYFLVRAQSLPFSLRSAVRLGLIGYFFNTFLPGSVGGDLLKAAAIARQQERRATAVATVIIDRGIGLWGLIALVALTGAGVWLIEPAWLRHRPDVLQIVRTALWVFGATLALWGSLGLLPDRRAARFRQRLEWFPRVGQSLGELWGAVWMYRGKSRVMLLGLAVSALNHAGMVAMFFFAALAFQPSGEPPAIPSFGEHFLIVPVGFVVQGLFPAPGGVGGGEFAFGKLYSLLGFPEVNGVLGSLGLRLLSWIVGAVGYAAYLASHKKPKADRNTASA